MKQTRDIQRTPVLESFDLDSLSLFQELLEKEELNWSRDFELMHAQRKGFEPSTEEVKKASNIPRTARKVRAYSSLGEEKLLDKLAAPSGSVSVNSFINGCC